MSEKSNRIGRAPKLIRIQLLPLIVILLLLLIADSVLPYLPARGAQGRQAATTPTAPQPTVTLTVTLSPSSTVTATSMPSDTPSPTRTQVVSTTPARAETAVAAVSPSPSASLSPVPSPSPSPALLAMVSPSPAAKTQTPTETAGTDTGGEMQALGELAGPAVAPTATIVAVVAVTASAVTPAAPVAASVIGIADVVRDGEFVQGFQENGVAVGWNNFNNCCADFSYHADTWPSAAGDAGRSQIMRIRNAQMPDRHLGIYQTFNVLPGGVYTFSIAGMVRTNAGDVQFTHFGYRVQVGFDTQGGRSWQQVREWTELPWDEQQRTAAAYRTDVYTTAVIARGNRMTIFVRAWKKWADAGEGAYDVTSVHLVGPAQLGVQALPMPVTGQGETSIWDNLRLWITLALLVMLVGGAVWRLRQWRRT